MFSVRYPHSRSVTSALYPHMAAAMHDFSEIGDLGRQRPVHARTTLRRLEQVTDSLDLKRETALEIKGPTVRLCEQPSFGPELL
jgi:hypothetical protein